MLDRIAAFISTITNPLILLIPVPYLLVFKVTNDFEYSLRWSFLALIFLIAIGLFVYLAVKKRVFSDFDVSIREQRPILFIVTGVIILMFFSLVHLINGPKIL